MGRGAWSSSGLVELEVQSPHEELHILASREALNLEPVDDSEDSTAPYRQELGHS